MTVHVSAVQRGLAMDAMFDVLNAGAIEIRSGAQEANPEANANGTLLASLSFGTPAFAPAAGAAGAPVEKTANAIGSDANADASGTAGHFRLVTPGAACVLIGDVAANGSDMNLPVAITAGATVALTTMVLSFPY